MEGEGENSILCTPTLALPRQGGGKYKVPLLCFHKENRGTRKPHSKDCGVSKI
ncbi:MAG: hypothetical protein L0922_03220 [Candidatus Mariimomonas ferrooxydans]